MPEFAIRRAYSRGRISTRCCGQRAGFDAIITNAAGCGSTLKEYDELFEHEPEYLEKAREFKSLMKDVTEFLASIELNREMTPVEATVTYQDSCHLAHGQKIRSAPRQLLRAIPGLKFREMPLSDICCGSAGIYNVLHTDLSMNILEKKMDNVTLARAEIVATANPGCMLQLEAGVRKWGHGERVAHVDRTARRSLPRLLNPCMRFVAMFLGLATLAGRHARMTCPAAIRRWRFRAGKSGSP